MTKYEIPTHERPTLRGGVAGLLVDMFEVKSYVIVLLEGNTYGTFY